MLTAAQETTKRPMEIVATPDGALRVDPSGARFSDLGLVIDASGVAAGAFVYSSWIDEVQWVRQVLLGAQGDRTHNVGLYRRDSSLTDIGGVTVASDQTANSPSWRAIYGSGTTGVLGYGCRFFLKNQDGTNPATLRLRVQLMG